MTQLDPRLLTSSVVGLCERIDRDPADHFLKELLADALGDAGASERLCEGLRWLAREELMPCDYDEEYEGYRYSFRVGGCIGDGADLPDSFADFITDPPWYISGPTPSAACLAVASAWERADEGLVAEWTGEVLT